MNRETIIRIVIAVVLTLAILVLMPHLFPTAPAPAPEAAKPALSKAEGTAPSGEKAPAAAEKAPAVAEKEKTPAAPTEKPATVSAAPGAKPASIRVVGGPEASAEEPILLGSDTVQGAYDLAAEVVPHGAAVRRLTLSRRHFFKTVADRKEPADQREAMALIEPPSPPAFTLPEVRIHLKDHEDWLTVDLSNSVWEVVKGETHSSQAVLEVKLLLSGGPANAVDKPLLVVRKSFILAPSPAVGAGAAALPQYNIHMKIEMVDAADEVDKVTYAVWGPPGLPAEGGRGALPTAVCGTWGKGTVDVTQLPATGKEIKKADALPDNKELGASNVAWAGEMDKYFAVVMIPQPPSPETAIVAKADSQWYRETRGQVEMAVPGVRLSSTELPVTGGAAKATEFEIFAGPKDDGLLSQLYGPLGLAKTIAWSAPCCCIPIPGLDYLSRFLVMVLELFHSLVMNYGVAIILLVVVLRALLHPVTRWSTKSMAEMQKLQPKIQEIREKYANDKQKMQEEMQKVGGLKMMGGCLPMFVQMPIWIALYSALGAAIQLRHAAFLPAGWLPEGSMFLQDLSAPDALVHWQTPVNLPGMDIPLLGWVLGALQGMLTGGAGGITSFNILPILMGVSMYLQQKFAPQPATTTPQMAQQRKMMSFMSVFFALILYSAPSGLNLYIATSTFLGVIEQRYIKKRLAEEEKLKEAALAEAEKTGAPPVARPVSMIAGRRKGLAERVQAWVQKKVEQGRAAQEREQKGKGRRGK